MWKNNGSPDGSVVKNMPAMQETQVQSLGLKIPWRSPGEGNGNPLQYSCLRNRMDRGTWWATVCGVVKSQTKAEQLTLLLSMLIKILGTCLVVQWLRLRASAAGGMGLIPG